MTLQLEMFAIISGLARHVVSLTSTVEDLSNTVKNLSNNARDLSTSVAALTAKITPQVSILQRQQPKSYAEAAGASNGQQPPTTPAKKGKKRSGTIGPTPPKNPKNKLNKDGKPPGPEDTATEDQLEDSVLVRHMETSCIHYWNPAHGPPKRTDPCAQTSKIRNRIFSTHTPAAPTLASYVTCGASSSCTRTQEFTSRAPSQ